MNESLHEHLTTLHQNNQPDNTFINQLEEKLRMAHQNQVQSKAIAEYPATSNPRYRLATLAATLVIVLGLIVAVPPVRSFAQDVFDSLFNRASGNRATITQSEDSSAPIRTSSIAEVETQADFDVKIPTYPLDNYQFVGASYNATRDAVNLGYEGQGRLLYITQQKAESASYGLLTDGGLGIGTDAPIVAVQVGDYAGEYVVGLWKIEETNGATAEVVWTPSASQRSLRWIQDGMLYEILAMGGSEGHNFIGQSEMIALALSLE